MVTANNRQKNAYFYCLLCKKMKKHGRFAIANGIKTCLNCIKIVKLYRLNR